MNTRSRRMELTAAYTMRTLDASPPFDKSVARQR
jgi:hypothetical protein